MARVRKKPTQPYEKPDLTPMIDIVFNLIIFFMVVSDMSALTVEELQLAYASEAQKPDALTAGERVLQINVMQMGGLIKVNGNAYTTDPAMLAAKKYPSLRRFLEIEAAGFEREEPDGSNPGAAPPSKMKVNIRADGDGAFKGVQEVFDACMRNGIYKTSLAASRDNPAGPGN